MPRPGVALMFQGTGSDVGKSLIVAGLCRAFTAKGLRVVPFKPQNMSNNAAVTADGGEIGRAQALQARACRIPPAVDMNPVLLKPQSETGAQVVVRGRVIGNATARAFQTMKQDLLPTVLASFEHMRSSADLVLVEGAGSASEINLRPNDIANMGFARAAGVPVILIGDIDRGGVIAQIAGTRTVLDPADAAMIVGFLVNKFRGDPGLFQTGMAAIESHSGWPGLGLIPFFPDAERLPAEDAMALDRHPGAPHPGTSHPGTRRPGAAARTDGPRHLIAVPRLAHIANFDDLDPLRLEASVELTIVEPGQPLPGDAAAVILPGSKATLADLAEFRRNGWDIDLLAHVRRGGHVIGICGGFQMLGRTVADPLGIEGPAETATGLGLLDVETILTGEKTLRQATGFSISGEVPFHGYEMHSGQTDGPDLARPLLRFEDGRPDGAISADGRIRATYVHGLFADDRQRAAFLAWLGAESNDVSYEAGVEQVLDALAAHLARHIDLDGLLTLAG